MDGAGIQTTGLPKIALTLCVILYGYDKSEENTNHNILCLLDSIPTRNRGAGRWRAFACKKPCIQICRQQMRFWDIVRSGGPLSGTLLTLSIHANAPIRRDQGVCFLFFRFQNYFHLKFAVLHHSQILNVLISNGLIVKVYAAVFSAASPISFSIRSHSTMRFISLCQLSVTAVRAL